MASSSPPPPPAAAVAAGGGGGGEKEVDQLGRLPEEVVMMIINKVFNAKALIQLSMVAKRYSTLPFQTHSLLMDFTVQGNGNPNATTTATYYSVPRFDANISAITHRFKQIKHLHLHIDTDDPACPVIPPLGNGGRFSQWVAVFGSQLERVHFLASTSVVVHGNGNAGNGEEEEEEEEEEEFDSDEYWSGVFQTIVVKAASIPAFIRGLVSQCPTIESVALSISSAGVGGGGGGVDFMGKPQIAKLKMFLAARERRRKQGILDDQANKDRFHARVAVFREPVLDLPRSGYTLNDVVFAKLVSVDGDGDDVEDAEMVSTSDSVAGLHGLDFDMEKWHAFLEAARLIEDENTEPMYTYNVRLSSN